MVLGRDVRFCVRYLWSSGALSDESDAILEFYRSSYSQEDWIANSCPICYAVPVLLVGDEVVVSGGDGMSEGSAFEICMSE